MIVTIGTVYIKKNHNPYSDRRENKNPKIGIRYTEFTTDKKIAPISFYYPEIQ